MRTWRNDSGADVVITTEPMQTLEPGWEIQLPDDVQPTVLVEIVHGRYGTTEPAPGFGDDDTAEPGQSDEAAPTGDGEVAPTDDAGEPGSDPADAPAPVGDEQTPEASQ